MDRLSKLVIGIALAVACISGHAGYAQLAPPPGFAPMPTASPERYGYAKAANEAWVNGTVRNTASLNVGGQVVKVPAAMRLASNAPRFAAAVLWAHPGLRVAAGLAGWLGVAGIVWDAVEGVWKKTIEFDQLGSCDINYTANDKCNAMGVSNGFTLKSATGVCKPHPTVTTLRIFEYTCIQTRTFDGYIDKKIGSDTVGAKVEKGATTRPLTKEEYEKELAPEVWRPDAPSIMPKSVPNELPEGTPLPVEQPIINPTPGDNPRPQPYFVPTGNPVPNPNYDPNAAPSPENQPWFQPGVRIVPSPTSDQPWRVDVQPVNRPTASPDPKSTDELNPQPDPATNPDSATDPGKDDKPKDEDKQDLCEKHPEILACQKLDEPENKELEQTTKDISITPDGGWGADNATCPAPKILHIQGREVAIPYDLFCTYMTGIRPIVLAMAWLTAAFILIGVRETS